jgi:hypothetical protein
VLRIAEHGRDKYQGVRESGMPEDLDLVSAKSGEDRDPTPGISASVTFRTAIDEILDRDIVTSTTKPRKPLAITLGMLVMLQKRPQAAKCDLCYQNNTSVLLVAESCMHNVNNRSPP